MIFIALTVAGAYLIGSIPVAVWIGRLFYGKDVRQFGSGNAGATNTFRVLGKTAGTIVLVLDIMKGIIAVLLAGMVKDQLPSADQYKLLEIILGIVATLGHIYPVFAGFKGGKGVATLTGVLFAVFPLAALVTTGVFLVVFLSTNYISLSSITSSLLFPLITYFIYPSYPAYLYSTLLLIPLLVIYTHRSNITRLVKEKKIKCIFLKRRRRGNWKLLLE